MNRRHFMKTSVMAGAIAPTLRAADLLDATAPPPEAPSAEWARAARDLPPDAHDAARSANQAARQRDPRPNLLFLYTDQQTLNAMSCAGNPWVRTPTMDALARRGLRFTQSYCPAPICGPSRASLVYGRMPHETGVRYNGGAPREDLENLGSALRRAGYDTTWAGKWHLPDSYPPAGEIPGFHYLRPPKETLGDFLGDAVDMHYATRAAHYLRWHAALSAKPWFLAVSLHNPHDICHYFLSGITGLPERDAAEADTRHLPPLPANHATDPDEPELLARRRRQPRYGKEMSLHPHLTEAQWRAYLQTYYHLTQSVDRCLAPILEALDAGGWTDNTLIIFTADHGEGVAAHQWFTKLSLYQETVQVPFIVLRPGEWKTGAPRLDQHHLVSGLDLFPTCLDYAGLPPDQWTGDLRGRSLRPLIDGNPDAPWRDHVVTAIDFDPARPEDAGRMVVTSDGWKLCAYSGGANAETLFNLNTDPGETTNLIRQPEHAAQAQRLRHLLAAWKAETNDPFPA